MKIKIVHLIFPDIKCKKSDIPKLRGFFSNKFPDLVELHNHLPGGKFCYKFPRIQYRVIDNYPALIAFDTGLDVIKNIFFKSNEIKLQDKSYTINEKIVKFCEYELGVSKEFHKYNFTSPWMALNEENFNQYKLLVKEEKQQFLNHLLRENLKTLSKGFEYTIPDIEQIKVEGYFKDNPVNFKNIKMLCFTGEFKVNFHIPDLIGLGKQSARGFGTVEKV